jgi:hypothetical protein
MTITLEWWQYILPAFVACAVVGLYMGWRVMGLWTVGVFFSGLVAARLGPKLELFINKFFSVMGEFFAIAADKDKAAIPTPQVTIASPWEPVATGLLFVALIAMSWWVARKLTGRGDVGVLGYLLGGIFGVLLGRFRQAQWWQPRRGHHHHGAPNLRGRGGHTERQPPHGPGNPRHRPFPPPHNRVHYLARHPPHLGSAEYWVPSTE